MPNLLEAISSTSLRWENPPPRWVPLPGDGMRVPVQAQVDYFRHPSGQPTKNNAPFLWMPVRGDFVAQARVRPAFTMHGDAGALMVYHDDTTWAKLCFEATSFGTTAAVSVVTNGVSDDANGPDLAVPDLWLQIFRSGNVFGMHYALDGQSWRRVRLFNLAVPAEVRLGLVAQCPAGSGTTIDFLNFNVESRTVQNMRTGI